MIASVVTISTTPAADAAGQFISGATKVDAAVRSGNAIAVFHATDAAADGVRKLDQARKAWRDLVRDTHPDVLHSRGVPPEAMKLAERRLQLINEAWREISAKEAA